MAIRRSSPFLLTLIPLAMGIVGCKPQAQQDPRALPDLVRIAIVEPAQEGDHTFTGVVTARVQSDLGFRVPGKVTKRYVDAGQVVRAGQPLMRMDVTDYAHAITAQGQNVEAAKAKATQAAADEARYRGLVATGAVSASAYDQIKAAADAAQAQLASVEAGAQVARDEGDYALLVADVDGTVMQTLAEPGQVVSSGQPVIKLAHAGPREAAVNLPETLRPALGSTAQATIYGKTGSDEARLRQLSDAADPLTRTFEARYVLAGEDARAPLGATVTVRLHDQGSPGSLRIPVTAITDRGKGLGVWVLNEKSSTVSFHPVKVLRIDAEDVIVSEGVKAGDPIVALGAHLLTEGQQVRVADERAAIR